MYIQIIRFFIIILAFVSCGQLGVSKDKDENTQRNLLLGAAILNSTASYPYTISFKAVAGNQTEVGCNQKIAGQPSISGSTNLYLKDLRFYVSDVYLVNSSGGKEKFNLTSDNKFQSESVALLDMEDGTGDCSGGTTETNKTLKGSAVGTQFTGIGFTIGVPEALNFLETTNQKAPLNVNAMYWSWKSGYKFFKFDYVTKDGASVSSSIHLGSGTCNGATATTPSTSCTQSNRTTIELKKTDGSLLNLGKDFVNLDIQSVLNGTNTTTTGLNCMAGNSVATCKSPLNNLGVDETTGNSNSAQKSFSIVTTSN